MMINTALSGMYEASYVAFTDRFHQYWVKVILITAPISAFTRLNYVKFVPLMKFYSILVSL